MLSTYSHGCPLTRISADRVAAPAFWYFDQLRRLNGYLLRWTRSVFRTDALPRGPQTGPRALLVPKKGYAAWGSPDSRGLGDGCFWERKLPRRSRLTINWRPFAYDQVLAFKLMRDSVTRGREAPTNSLCVAGTVSRTPPSPTPKFSLSSSSFRATRSSSLQPVKFESVLSRLLQDWGSAAWVVPKGCRLIMPAPS